MRHRIFISGCVRPSEPLSINQYDDDDDDDDEPLLPTAVGEESDSPAEHKFAKLTAELETAVARAQTAPFWIGAVLTVVVTGLAIYSAARAPDQLYRPAEGAWYLGAWAVVQPLFWTALLMLKLMDRAAGRSSRPTNQLFVFLAFAGTTIRFYVWASKCCYDPIDKCGGLSLAPSISSRKPKKKYHMHVHCLSRCLL